MRFSERYGYKPVREIIQKESINQDLKNRIWSCIYDNFYTYYLSDINFFSYSVHLIWRDFYKQQTDVFPFPPNEAVNQLKRFFLQEEWFGIYDLIEEIIILYSEEYSELQKIFIEEINKILDQENSAYRIINQQITEITSEQEIQSIEEALKNSQPYSGIQQHLNQALKLMSDRQNPNYSKSMQEAISAVEGLAKKTLEDDSITLGKAIPKLRTKYAFHPNLMESLNKLYAYTCDENGIRHGSPHESNLSYIDAKFMLVACTNFINYLIEKTKDHQN
ncbi:AbiJ-NTD4 domain-containing protein [Acinetobacter lwoffii]|uniref:AbiJ-NTD4 domain-containing protein n=1 Tax=Acinetobacter lwoffii TaxID=28090 RepID=UPI0015D21364|nr:hypothetical protein [Acinetobacter lwoffii]MCJ8511509.1 hypothetical protein [Acinetobacter lwoffii]